MDPDQALRLTQSGGMLLLMDVPRGTEVGIDYQSWLTDSHFGGFKMIPPGIHWVFFSARGPTADAAPRAGFFALVRPQEVLVRRWSVETELLERVSEADEGALVAAARRMEFDRKLAPYPFEHLRRWKTLSCFVTEATLARVEPVSGVVSSEMRRELVQAPGASAAGDAAADATATSTSAAAPSGPSAAESEPAAAEVVASASSGTDLPRMHFTPLPPLRPPGSWTPAARTAHAMDKSDAVERLVATRYGSDPQELLGEMQVAFVCFLLGQSMEALEYWKHAVALLCGCDRLVCQPTPMSTRLFVDFVRVMRAQIREIPADFFLDALSKENFLGPALRSLFATAVQGQAAGGNVPEQLLHDLKRLSKHCRTQFGVDLAVPEDDEDAPVVVPMDEVEDV